MSENKLRTLTIEIQLPYETEASKESDDDGCGSPSKTGNSMTGPRGSYYVCSGVTCPLSDLELRKLVEQALLDQNQQKLDEEVNE